MLDMVAKYENNHVYYGVYLLHSSTNSTVKLMLVAVYFVYKYNIQTTVSKILILFLKI
jgi:hypothetical protein